VSYAASWYFTGTSAPLFLAVQKGYFAEGGLDVSLARGYGASDSVKRAATGQADVISGDIGTAMLMRANEGAQIKIISPTFGGSPAALLFYEDQNIRVPKDLEGKTIADAAGSSPRVLFPAFAGLTGIDPNKVNWRTVDANVRNTHMAAGQLEIISAFIANLADIEQQAYSTNPNRRIAAMKFIDYGVDMYGDGYLASEQTIAEKPQVLAAFVQAAAKGMRDMFQDPAAAVDAVHKSNPDLDQAVGIRQIELSRNIMISDDMKANGIGTFQEARLQNTRDLMIQYFGMNPGVPLSEMYTTQFVPPTPVLP
jgi:NitT/TauT family transport system substrate-binding protein